MDDADLIRVTNHHTRGRAFNFVIPPSASARFDEHHAGEAVLAATEPAESPPRLVPTEADPTAVMVVHGRNEEGRQAMFAFIERLGLKPLDRNDLIARNRQGGAVRW